MKISKKLKWTLGLIGLTSISIIPMSVALTSCGNGGDKYNNDEFSTNFVENMKDPNASILINESKYNQILKIHDNYLDMIKNTSVNSPNELAANWLESATEKDIEEMLLINFNREDKFLFNYKHWNETKNIKQFIDVEIINYDKNSKNLSFKLKFYYNFYSEVNINLNKDDPYNEYGIDANETYYIMEQNYLEYNINNFKLIMCDATNLEHNNNPLPTLTLGIQTNSSIECINSNAKYNSNILEIYNKIFNNVKNSLDNPSDALKSLEKISSQHTELINISKNNFNEIKNLNWNSPIKFNNTSQYLGLPLCFEYWDWNMSLNYINVIGIHKWESSDDLTIVKDDQYYLPLFVISQFNSDNSNIEIIQ